MQYDRKDDYNEDCELKPTEIMEDEDETLDMYHKYLHNLDLADDTWAVIKTACEALKSKKFARGKEEKEGFREIENYVHAVRLATRTRYEEEVERLVSPRPDLSKMARCVLYTWATNVTPISPAVAEDYYQMSSVHGRMLSFLQIESRTNRGFLPWVLQSKPFLHIAKIVNEYRFGLDSPVRVQIDRRANMAIVVAMLRKTADWLESNQERLTEDEGIMTNFDPDDISPH